MGPVAWSTIVTLGGRKRAFIARPPPRQRTERQDNVGNRYLVQSARLAQLWHVQGHAAMGDGLLERHEPRRAARNSDEHEGSPRIAAGAACAVGRHRSDDFGEHAAGAVNRAESFQVAGDCAHVVDIDPKPRTPHLATHFS